MHMYNMYTYTQENQSYEIMQILDKLVRVGIFLISQVFYIFAGVDERCRTILKIPVWDYLPALLIWTNFDHFYGSNECSKTPALFSFLKMEKIYVFGPLNLNIYPQGWATVTPRYEDQLEGWLCL